MTPWGNNYPFLRQLSIPAWIQLQTITDNLLPIKVNWYLFDAD